jgi:phenylacetic acid degradation operon negative regulatory protein
MPEYFHPERKWSRPWNKLWYMLIYDIPETDRKYRNVLRQFLRKKHLGLLQQSVWITPEDIRPDFNDLVEAASIDAFAYLFESRTVLGLPSHTVVENAWNVDALHDRQEHFCRVTDSNITALQADDYPLHELIELLRMTLTAFHAAMYEDPLLPDALLPGTYAGKRAYASLQELLKEIDKHTCILQLS